MENNSWVWPSLGSAFGLEFTDPTSDRRVLEFCLGIPAEQFFKMGIDRYIIRHAMRGLLPQEILMNRIRGIQGVDLIQRIAWDKKGFEEALDDIESSPQARHFLDLPRLRTMLNSAGTNPNMGALGLYVNVFMRGIMFGLFLKKFETGRGQAQQRNGTI